jgi:uncharacterized membrane protein YfcA
VFLAGLLGNGGGFVVVPVLIVRMDRHTTLVNVLRPISVEFTCGAGGNFAGR